MQAQFVPDDLELMANNLMQLRRHVTEESPYKIYDSYDHQEETNRQSHKGEVGLLREEYERYLTVKKLPMDHSSKIEYLIEEKWSVGNAIALFEMIYYFRQALDHSILEEIHQKYLQALKSSSKAKEKRCFGELISICSVQDEELCQYVTQELLKQQEGFELCMLILTNQGQIGLAYLVELAQRDIPQFSDRVIDFLSRTQYVVKQIVIPALIHDVVNGNNPKNVDLSLSALNRLGPILQKQHVETLASLIHDSSVDKMLLIATIRASGLEGEKKLIEIINSKHCSQAILSLCLGVLSWRIPARHVLRIRSISYTLENCLMPGKLYQYTGSMGVWDFKQSYCADGLCLSSRQLLAQLSKLLYEGMKDEKNNNSQFYKIREVLDLNNDEVSSISEDVIETLGQFLRHKSEKIRELVLLQLGNIGAEAAGALEKVGKCLWDGDSSVRSAACWVIARIGQKAGKKIENRLTQLMKDSFWKVRTSAAITIGSVGEPLASTLQTLLRCLQDGSISKPTLCEALVKLGGQEICLDLLRSATRGDFKLRQALISSLAFCSISSPHLSTTVQELIKHCKDARVETREICLLTIKALKEAASKEEESVAFLQVRHLLPIFYCFLDDQSPRIRSVAAQSIMGLGGQAELVFIQGMTKGSSNAKIQCIKCLGRLGVQNFRAIVLGLRDDCEKVRKVANETILRSFNLEDILNEYKDNPNHSISLVCNLKEAMLRTNNKDLKQLIEEVIRELESKGKAIMRTNQNRRPN